MMNREIDHELLCMGCMREREAPDGPCQYCGYEEKQEGPSHYLPCRSVLNGKYLVGRVIGEGGFGITYLGWDLNLDMKVAIKEYYPSGLVTRVSASSPEVVSYTGDKAEYYIAGKNKFVQEAKTLAKFFALPGIVGVKDFFQESNTSYIVMEYIEGVTLKEYLRQCGGKIPAPKVLEWMKPLIHSLEAIHRAGLIHRDISPDNIMITDEDKVKLLDFGAARDISPDGGKSLSVMLKPGYAPEEQYRTHGSQGPWTDVYALCATMYKCMTGVTPPEPLERMREDTLQRPTLLGAALTPQQEEAIMQGLFIDAQDRFQSMEALERALYSETGESSRYRDPAYEAEIAGQYRERAYEAEIAGQYREPPSADEITGGASTYRENMYRQDNTIQDSPSKSVNKKRKRLIAAICTAAVLLCMSCIVLALIPGKKKEERRYGNTACNMIGAGLAVTEEGDTYFKVYFDLSEDTDSSALAGICGEKADRSAGVSGKIAEGQIYFCSYWDGWVYYINLGDYYLWRVRKDGTGTEKVSGESVAFYQIMDGKIFYVSGKDEGVFVMNMDGTGRKLLISDKTGSCIGVLDGWVYYSKRGEGQYKLYKIRADGSEETFLSLVEVNPVFAVTEDGIYISSTDTEEEWNVALLKKMNLEGYETRLPRIAVDVTLNDNLFNISGGWIYYANADDSSSLYRIHEDGTEKEKISDKKPIAICEAGGQILFVDEDYRWYLYDGSGVWPKYSGEKMEGTETEASTVRQTEPVTEPEPATEPVTEPVTAEARTESGTPEETGTDGSGNESDIMYGGAYFPYLDSVIERIQNDEMTEVPLGTQNKAYLYYYTIKDARFVRDPGVGDAAQDCLIITVEMATEIDEPGYTMSVKNYDFIAAVMKEYESDMRFCLPQSYRDPDTDGENEWHSFSGSMPLEHGAFRTRELNFPIPKGYGRFTIIQTNLSSSNEAAGPLYLTQDQ